MGHGSMRAALAYHAVVGWIDMVLTIAGWPLELRLRDWTRTTAGRIKRPSRCAACGRSRATQLPRLLDPTLTSAASRVIAGDRFPVGCARASTKQQDPSEQPTVCRRSYRR